LDQILDISHSIAHQQWRRLGQFSYLRDIAVTDRFAIVQFVKEKPLAKRIKYYEKQSRKDEAENHHYQNKKELPVSC
jgi:hypothetical protein